MGKITTTEPIDFDLFKQLADIHNMVSFKKAEQSEFDDFIEKNLEQLYHPPILAILCERADIFGSWLEDNPRFSEYSLKILNHFIDENEQFHEGLGEYLGLRGRIRIGLLYSRLKGRVDGEGNESNG